MSKKNLLITFVFIALLSLGCQPQVDPVEEPADSGEPSLEESAPEPTDEPLPTVDAAEPTTPPPAPTEDEKFPPTSTPIPESSELEEDSDMSEFDGDPKVAKAVEDLTGRMAVTAADIKILSVENKTWPDSSLGCPQEGMMYMQMLVEGGMLIQLEMNGTVYNYHSGPDGDPFLCENQ